MPILRRLKDVREPTFLVHDVLLRMFFCSICHCAPSPGPGHMRGTREDAKTREFFEASRCQGVWDDAKTFKLLSAFAYIKFNMTHYRKPWASPGCHRDPVLLQRFRDFGELLSEACSGEDSTLLRELRKKHRRRFKATSLACNRASRMQSRWCEKVRHRDAGALETSRHGPLCCG